MPWYHLLFVGGIAVLSGLVQSVTRSGGGIMAMLFLPNFMPMKVAPALSDTICTPLSGSISWKYRKFISRGKILVPAIFYLISSGICIKLSTVVNLDSLKAVFGGLLVVLAFYFIFFSGKIHLKGNFLTAFLCSLFSGVMAGFFGIGGPLMVLYYLAVTDEKEDYLGTINLFFTITAIYQIAMRAITGVLTLDLVPLMLAGIAGVLVGKTIGGKIVDRINGELMKKIIYVFLAIAGVITIIKAVI